ncbi:two-component sensor histidine kinase [Paenibacillus sp. MY03]|jgi:NarL family two-component system sensor histidine kinase LiaS|uniref:Oxygen sensor histidine kinase NreB n=1 Tax=Paenibacillus agaridevorans TaxID=171404 RepID=A0A2R5EZV1_9BACL|nr:MULTISPECIES: sensor histidine kinase [Paenibacillus]OUS73999.1 two-component sensor histidine kinase [Paenibacillus sp. MY03]GBG11179.1 two-component sensor histidine kinase [Paenibacillus agaridevorans]
MQAEQDKRSQGDEGPKAARKRNTAETVLWLLIIVSLAVIVLQGLDVVELYTLKGKWAVMGLIGVGGGLVAATIMSYLQNSKLKAALKRLTEQQRKRPSYTVTIDSNDPDAVSPDELADDPNWREKVRFTAVIEERQRLARELHDAVSQQLFAISMTATAVSRTIERDWERAKRQVQLIEEMAAVAQSEMRALLLHLRPVHLEGKNLGQALKALIEELQQKIPMEITLEVDETITLLPAAEDHLFRIAQEALSNTLRHSKADKMHIRLMRLDNRVHMTLQDSGIGFDLEVKKQTSYGLLTMEERVNELGGSMQMMSQPGEGTTIHLWVPVDGQVKAGAQ